MIEIKFTLFRIPIDIARSIAELVSEAVMLIGGDLIFEIKSIPLEESNDQTDDRQIATAT